MENFIKQIVNHYDDGDLSEKTRQIVVEEPLEIHVQGKPYSILMRTPGDELALVAGFCLSEGLIDSHDDLSSIGYCKDIDSNRILVQLTEKREKLVSKLLQRSSFRSQTSCGLCGKEMIDDICTEFNKIEKINVKPEILIRLQDDLKKRQKLFKETGGTHGALISDADGIFLSFAEDVGRHNAFDKAIGNLILEKKLNKAKIALLSSRGSFEMIQKAARANIPVVVCVSAPTSLAIELAKKAGVKLIGFLRGNSYNIYCD
ncbi:MAG: formate dehydrogenase accessory sulfurtransferase FdhD [Pseudomonadota bacterium]